MMLLALLILLLAIAWGVADYQLQARIEREPPPVTAPTHQPATPPAAPVDAESGAGDSPAPLMGAQGRSDVFVCVLPCGMPGLAPAGDSLSCSCKKVSKEARPAFPALRAEGSPEARPFARRTAKQLAVRNPALTPRCGRPAGPVAKLA